MWNIFKTPSVQGFMVFAQFHKYYMKKNFGKNEFSP
jgi:hypothetical protein